MIQLTKILISSAAIVLLVGGGVSQAQPGAGFLITRLDKNGDRALDKAEWAPFGSRMPFPVKADANHDGKINAAELEAVMTQFRKERQSK